MLKTKIILTLFFLLAANFLTSGVVRASDNPSASLSMATATYAPGSTFPVTVYENSNEGLVNVVSVDLKYDPSQLEFTGIDSSASGFGGTFKSYGGQGIINIIRYVTPFGGTVSGNIPVFTVTFKALSGTTASTIDFQPTSMVLSSGKNIWDGVNNGGSFGFITPLAQPPAVATGTTKPIASTTSVKKTSLPPLGSKSTIVTETKGLATTNYILNTPYTQPDAANPMLKFLVAVGLGVITLVAMYFNAHVKIARHTVRISKKSAHRFKQKKMIIKAQRQIRHTT